MILELTPAEAKLRISDAAFLLVRQPDFALSPGTTARMTPSSVRDDFPRYHPPPPGREPRV